jgi:uncharacterized protein involved in exopolysaccharide biosynthesis
MSANGSGAAAGWRRSARVRILLVIGAVTLGALAGLGFSMLREPQYEAIATILIPAPEGDQVPERQLLNQTTIITSTPVLQHAAERYGGNMDATLARRLVSAEASDVADVVTLRALGSDAEAAVSLANAVVASYLTISQETGQATPEEVAPVQEQERVLRERIVAVDRGLRDDPSNPGLQAELKALTDYLQDRVTRELQMTLGDVSRVSNAVVLGAAQASLLHDQVLQTVGLGALIGLATSVGFVLWWLPGKDAAAVGKPDGLVVRTDERYLAANGGNGERRSNTRWLV